MIPCHQRVTILERIVAEKEKEAIEMTKTKRDQGVRTKLLPNESDNQEDP